MCFCVCFLKYCSGVHFTIIIADYFGGGGHNKLIHSLHLTNPVHLLLNLLSCSEADVAAIMSDIHRGGSSVFKSECLVKEATNLLEPFELKCQHTSLLN